MGDKEKKSDPDEHDYREEENKEPEEEEEEENNEPEDKGYVTHDEFNAQQQLVEDISSTVLDIQETVKKLVPVPSASDKKEGETPGTPEHKDTTPQSPDIKIENPIEYLYVRKRGGRVVRREKVKK